MEKSSICKPTIKICAKITFRQIPQILTKAQKQIERSQKRLSKKSRTHKKISNKTTVDISIQNLERWNSIRNNKNFGLETKTNFSSTYLTPFKKMHTEARNEKNYQSVRSLQEYIGKLNQEPVNMQNLKWGKLRSEICKLIPLNSIENLPKSSQNFDIPIVSKSKFTISRFPKTYATNNNNEINMNKQKISDTLIKIKQSYSNKRYNKNMSSTYKNEEKPQKTKCDKFDFLNQIVKI